MGLIARSYNKEASGHSENFSRIYQVSHVEDRGSFARRMSESEQRLVDSESEKLRLQAGRGFRSGWSAARLGAQQYFSGVKN